MYTEEVNKIALSNNDDKRLQTFDRVTIYPYGTNAFNVCETEILGKCFGRYKWSILMLMKIKLNTIKTDHILQITHAEY